MGRLASHNSMTCLKRARISRYHRTVQLMTPIWGNLCLLLEGFSWASNKFTPSAHFCVLSFCWGRGRPLMCPLYVVPIISMSPGCVIFYWTLPSRYGWWWRGPLLLLLPPLPMAGRRGESGRKGAERSGRKGGRATPSTLSMETWPLTKKLLNFAFRSLDEDKKKCRDSIQRLMRVINTQVLGFVWT